MLMGYSASIRTGRLNEHNIVSLLQLSLASRSKYLLLYLPTSPDFALN